MAGERKEYITAFLIGAIVGAGATMLLAPDKKKKHSRFRLRPAAPRARQRSRRFRKTLRNRLS